jgi:ribosome-binding protein aMBF1 (putative translation factor)
MKNRLLVQDTFCSVARLSCNVSENQSRVSRKEDSELIVNDGPTSRFDRITFGQRVRSLRSERDFSQEDLAQLIFLSPSQLSRVESGLKKNISIELVEALATALGVTVVVLLGWA